MIDVIRAALIVMAVVIVALTMRVASVASATDRLQSSFEQNEATVAEMRQDIAEILALLKGMKR